ncbi:MAG: DegT/DnrJ/EryC1/StrS family aminotransferase [Deltaproteobacteria bacterium]|nr:DegT/DnrJ/EryC1/StrS family aminotransferase [Deltaproteobacteria bacterium]MBW2073700.1 DegT/DnrJ/EryC1/StrS family aminotransferase [Deltaproteobacteria bacterium]
MKVPLLDLKAQYQIIKDEVIAATQALYETQRFILGPEVEKLEEQIARYCHTRYAVGVSSGTDALLISLMAAGIGPGDEVITSPYTFFATVGSIVRVGATPVFVDIQEDTYNMDPEAISDKITKQTKAIIPVHLYGQCCDMEPILELARSHHIMVIEDAAQAIGAEYRNRRAGSMGDMGCFSFFPSKNLGAFGDGGMVTTSSDVLYESLKRLRVHGSSPKYYHKVVGGNFRLDALQAAILRVKLAYLEQWTSARQANARRYRALFSHEGLNDFIGLPIEKNGRHIYNQFVIAVQSRRDDLKRFLSEAGIGTEIYYPVPLHLQPCFEYLNATKGSFPMAEAAAEKTLALPIYAELTDEQQAYVVRKIKAFYSS